MVKNLKTHIEKIKQFDGDRLFWLRLSGFVLIAIVLIVVDLTFFNVRSIHWILVSLGFILSITWWYWTMKLVRELLNHRLVEVEILSELINDIREIKQDVKKLDQDS